MSSKHNTLLHTLLATLINIFVFHTTRSQKFEKLEASDTQIITKPKEVVFGTSTTYSAFGHWVNIGTAFPFTLGFV